MEQSTTKVPFRYWVTEILPSDGSRVIMRGWEFQDDVDELDWEAPPRKLLAISPTEKRKVLLHLSSAHVSPGSAASVEGWRERMNPPFLLTDSLDAAIIWNQELDLALTEEAKHLFTRDWPSVAYPVETNNWFGIVTRRDGSRVHLIAFGTNAEAKIQNGESIRFTQWDGTTTMGTVARSSF